VFGVAPNYYIIVSVEKSSKRIKSHMENTGDSRLFILNEVVAEDAKSILKLIFSSISQVAHPDRL